RAAVVEDLDVRIVDDVLPARRPLLVAVAPRRLLNRVLRPSADRDEPWDVRRRPRHVRDLLQRVRVRLAHEGIPEHPDPDRRDLLGRLRLAHRDEADVLLAQANHQAWPGTSGLLMISGFRYLMHCSHPSSS